MVPPLMKYPGDPDFPKIQAAVADQIARSEAMDRPTPSATAVPAGDASARTKPKGSSSASSADPGKRGADTSNLSKVCSA